MSQLQCSAGFDRRTPRGVPMMSALGRKRMLAARRKADIGGASQHADELLALPLRFASERRWLTSADIRRGIRPAASRGQT
jgi:hypothetical protein